MELDDLKNTWEDLNNQVEKQHNLTTKVIDQMTQAKYLAGLKKVAHPETTGALICFIGAAFIALNFNNLDTTFFRGVGIMSILLLLTLPVVSIISLRQLNIMGDVNKTYAEALRRFAIQKIRFYKFQRLNITLSYLLLVGMIILLPRFFGGKDVTGYKYFWTFAFSFGYLFLFFFSRWVFRYYKKTLQQAEELLLELGPH